VIELSNIGALSGRLHLVVNHFAFPNCSNDSPADLIAQMGLRAADVEIG
jgi:hypothetical protein